jgi:hypothetical protein
MLPLQQLRAIIIQLLQVMAILHVLCCSCPCSSGCQLLLLVANMCTCTQIRASTRSMVSAHSSMHHALDIRLLLACRAALTAHQVAPAFVQSMGCAIRLSPGTCRNAAEVQ